MQLWGHCLAPLALLALSSQACTIGVGVLSASANLHKRMSIRETWFQYAVEQKNEFQARFFIATPIDPRAMTELQLEADFYQDIVIVDSEESYHRTSYQVLALYQHFVTETQCLYIAKVDDDVLLRVPLLLTYVSKQLSATHRHPAKRWIGWMEKGALPHRQGRYAIREDQWSVERGEYPKFAVGVAHLMTRALASVLVSHHEETKAMEMFALEDIAVALWVDTVYRNEPSAIQYLDDRRFFRQRICDHRTFNVLLERAAPMFVDPNATMHTLYHKDRSGMLDDPTYCPKGIRLEDMKGKDRVKLWVEWEARYKELDAAFAVRRQALLQEWQAKDAAPRIALAATTAPEIPVSPVLVVVDKDMASWHYHLARMGPVRDCDVPCYFRIGMERLDEAHAAVFLGDKELYTRIPQELPPKPRLEMPYYVVMREYLALFPSELWNRYDDRITYSTDSTTAVTYSYAAPALLEQAKESPTFEERSANGQALAAFVSIRCGREGDPKDGRNRRTQLVQNLQALGEDMVDSYGVCARNRDWPMNHKKDKSYVMRHHRFCIAMENNLDKDYVTEKLWDCLLAGAVPVYWGAPNFADHIPGGRASVILVNDHATPEALAAHLRHVGQNKTIWESYRAWMHHPQPQPWLDLMAKIDPRHVQCNVCRHVLARQQRKDLAGSRDEL